MVGNTIILIHMRLLVTVVDGELTPRRSFLFPGEDTPEEHIVEAEELYNKVRATNIPHAYC